MDKKFEPVEIDNCSVRHATDKAILVRTEDGTEAWIPISQIDDDSEVYAADTDGTLIIPRWLAESSRLV